MSWRVIGTDHPSCQEYCIGGKMTENSLDKMNSAEKPHKSISRKALYGIFINFIVFAVVAELVAITFYAVTSTRGLRTNADSLFRQTILSVTYGADVISFAN